MIDDGLLDAYAVWRRSTPISPDRIQELQSRLQIAVDIQQGIFPFGGVTLTRADIEWLLVNHDGGRGPVNWADPTQRGRKGIDLRGANLAGEDLSDLPLSRMLGGLTTDERIVASKDVRSRELRDIAAVHFEGANLDHAHLEGAFLRATHLEGACLLSARLDNANLSVTHMEGS